MLALAGGKVEVVGLPNDFQSPCPTLPICTKKKTPGIGYYDPRVLGHAKFIPGMITLIDGTDLKGDIALLSEPSDWAFVKRTILVIPEGETQALYLGSGDAIYLEQSHKKGVHRFDLYGSSFLKRRVSGRYRLSFNPAAGASKGVLSMLPKQAVDELRKQSAESTVRAALNNGKGVRASLEAAKANDDAIVDVLSSIEITDKEYLIYDEKNDELEAITQSTWSSWLSAHACDAADAKLVKKFKNYKSIDEAVTFPEWGPLRGG